MERAGLGMIFSLQKYKHYLLDNIFTFYTYHQSLKYLINNPVHRGHVYRWLLLLQEFEFELLVQLEKNNIEPNHLSRVEIREEATGIDDENPYAHLF